MIPLQTLQYTLFYNFIFLAFFFLGFDNYLIWARTFLEGKTYETEQYAHYALSIFAGWFLGFALFKRTVNKYDSSMMIKYSFLLASFAAWCQYRTSMQAVDVQFSSIIVLNLVFNLAVSFLAYTLKKIATQAHEANIVSKNSIIALIFAVLSISFSFIFISKNLHFYFLCTSFIYLMAYLFFRFSPILNDIANQSGNENVKSIKKTKAKNGYALPFGIMIGLIILAIIAYLTKTNHTDIFDQYCNTASFIFIFMAAYILGKPLNKKFFIYLGIFLSLMFLISTITFN